MTSTENNFFIFLGKNFSDVLLVMLMTLCEWNTQFKVVLHDEVARGNLGKF